MDESCRKHRFIPRAEAVSRRSVARGALGSGLVATLLATVGRRNAHAQATPPAAGGTADGADDTGPRRYTLSGEQTAIVFVPATAGGAAQLDYRGATDSLSFAGDEVDTARAEPLGQLATVVLESAPDGFVRYLTLLVPEVNRDEDQPDVPISTLAILTTHWTSIGGPALVKGALQTYEVAALDGVAEFGPA
ncbi:MAG: hypothetical protein QOJ59_4101 [Thermomicrobiales bacterium]|nr:hypothetical protein [Thermomicrobiales bacterium]